jgi:hypothetical protein
VMVSTLPPAGLRSVSGDTALITRGISTVKREEVGMIPLKSITFGCHVPATPFTVHSI